MLATALSSSSRTAGLLTVGSTLTTSTLGTSSGRSPVGASLAGHAAVRSSTYIDGRRSGFRPLAVRVAGREEVTRGLRGVRLAAALPRARPPLPLRGRAKALRPGGSGLPSAGGRL